MRIEGGFRHPVTTLVATTEGLTLRVEEQDDPGRRVVITFGEGDVRGMAEMLGLVLGDAADGAEPTELDGCPGAILAPELGGEG